jgi:hypothetical protein
MALPDTDEVTVPRYVISDIEPYRSPIDGSVVGGRAQKRYDLEKNGCVEAEPRKKRDYRNPSFALKRGLKLSDEARQ